MVRNWACVVFGVTAMALGYMAKNSILIGLGFITTGIGCIGIVRR